MTEQRTCKQCGQAFTRIVRAAQLYCSAKCRRKYWNTWDHIQGHTARRHNADPRKMMLRSAKHRAKVKGLPFNIELSDIVIPDVCPILGIPLVPNGGTGVAKKNSPSLDKIIPSLGYVKGNVQVISNLANLLKGDASEEELLLFGLWAVKTYGSKDE